MTILDTIVKRKLEEVRSAKATVSVSQLEKESFFKRNTYSLREEILNRSGIIAEFKRKSPSKGVINDKVTVAEVTQGYQAAGASALSVLTDTDFFMGHEKDLREARANNEIPILRKDFMIDEYQILEAKAWGADVILLIAAILSPSEIKSMAKMAKNLGLSVLLEVHNLEELQRSVCYDLDAIGVNNRNLKDFRVDVQYSFDLVNEIPEDFIKVSESAISAPETIKSLKEVGYHGFLIGENFMKTPHPGEAMQLFVNEL